MKVYRDGDTDLPTICGTGLEDYVGSAWGMGQHDAPYAGAHLVLSGQGKEAEGMGTQPDFVSFYRWHVPDPIMFERDLKVTIQQIGAMFFVAGPGGREGGLRRRPTRSPARAGRPMARRRCSPGGSASGSTTTRARPTCTARSRRACRPSTWPPPSPTSSDARTSSATAWKRSPRPWRRDAPPHRHRAASRWSATATSCARACSTATRSTP